MSRFLSGIAQEDIAIRQYSGRSPMFFRSFNMMAGVFTADLAVCRSLLPNDQYHALQPLPGRGLVGIHCMEYHDTDVGPYNEVSVSVGVSMHRPYGSFTNIVRSTISNRFHAFIVQLPVTTEVAYFGGIDHFNYPKFVANITFEEKNGKRVCKLSELKSNQEIMTFEGKMISTRKSERGHVMELNSYPVMDGEAKHARMRVNLKEKGERFLPSDGRIIIGNAGFSEMLTKLDIGKQIHYLYAPLCESVMYLPRSLKDRP